MTQNVLPSGPLDERDGPAAQGTDRMRFIAAGAGFALSAGWYWFPCMHPLWMGNALGVVPPGGSAALPGVMLLFLGIKAVALLIFGWLLKKTALNILFTLGNRLAGSPFRERVTLILPFLVFQFAAWLFLMPLLMSPDRLPLLAPVLLGASEVLFSLIWFCALACLPGVGCCLGYGLGALFSLFLYGLTMALPAPAARLAHGLLPLLACPLLFFALPATETIKGFRFKYDFLCAARHDPALAASYGTPPPYIVLGIFAVAASLQLLLSFTESGFLLFGADTPALLGRNTLPLFGHACGGFLAALLLRGRHLLWVPVLALAFFGGCAVVLPLIGVSAGAPAPALLLHLAAGITAAFAFLLISAFVRAGRPLVSTVGWALLLFNLFSYLGGALLWIIAVHVQRNTLLPQVIYFQLLGLVLLLSILPFYALRGPLRNILGMDGPGLDRVPPRPVEKPILLTKRETEVAILVQQGMKNLEISTQLNIAETTLRVHLRSIYRKLGVIGRPNLSAVDLGPHSGAKAGEGRNGARRERRCREPSRHDAA